MPRYASVAGGIVAAVFDAPVGYPETPTVGGDDGASVFIVPDATPAEFRGDASSLRLSSSNKDVRRAAQRFARRKEYIAKGASLSELVVALWERIVENRQQASQDIQAIRDQVKTQFPVEAAP